MSPFLFERLSEICRRVAEAPSILLFCDYDGTLTPIVNNPADAHLSAEVKGTLARLARQDRITTAIISGRSLSDVRERVGIDGLIYAGNHGLEISGPGFHFIEPTSSARREDLIQLSERLSHRLSHIKGAWVEQKGLTASVHFRTAEISQVSEIIQVVSAVTEEERQHFHLTRGKKVCEIRPHVSWHKGTAALWIVERVGRPYCLPICIGDDATDEDAFAAFPQGILVRVGRSETTIAHYHVDNTDHVHDFFLWLLETTRRYAPQPNPRRELGLNRKLEKNPNQERKIV